MVECKRLSAIGHTEERLRRLVTGPYWAAEEPAPGHHRALDAPVTTARRGPPGACHPEPVEQCGSPDPPHPHGAPSDCGGSPPTRTRRPTTRRPDTTGHVRAIHDGPAGPTRRLPSRGPVEGCGSPAAPAARGLAGPYGRPD